jgi:DNA polymerase
MGLIRCSIDFETFSVGNLKDLGAEEYANHPTTEALMMSYSIGDGKVYLWKQGDPFPSRLKKVIETGNFIICAHNAQFEFFLWNITCVKKYDWPSIPMKKFDCTMVRGLSMGLPGKLEQLAPALGLKEKKDSKGHRVMLQIAKPKSGPDKKCEYCNGTGVFKNECCICIERYTPEEHPEKFKIVEDYCVQDVVVEKVIEKRLLKLTTKERKLWLLDQKINHRGIYVDRESVKRALKIVEIEKLRLDELMQKATKGYVGTCNSSVALRDWINKFDIYKGEVYSKDGPPSKRKSDKGKPLWKKGAKKIVQGVGKDQIKDLLEMKLPKKIKAAILIRKEAAKSSTAKLKMMLKGSERDSRLRGTLQFYGAASTGRWAGRRVQPQNMTRPETSQKFIERIIDQLNLRETEDAIRYIDTIHGPPMTRIADCLRGMLCAPRGRKFIAGDFTAIEGRALVWLTGEERVLNIYRGHGRIYEDVATKIYGLSDIKQVTKPQRLIGKVTELACGYQGAQGAFQSMAKNYLVKVDPVLSRSIVKKWRESRPRTVDYWYKIEKAAIKAVEYPGEKVSHGPEGRKVTFLVKGSFLFCRLPSGRAITYPYPKLKRITTPWGQKKNALHYKGIEQGQWRTRIAYGGLITENIDSGFCRDLLAEAMFRLEDAGYPIAFTVHDEIASEIDKNFGSLEEFLKIMSVVPDYAKGLPIGVDGWAGSRYRK